MRILKVETIHQHRTTIFPNSFVEGKSFSATNGKKSSAADKSIIKDISTVINSGPDIKIIDKEVEQIDKKIKQKQYVKELEDQIKLRDKIKQDEEQKLLKKRGTIDTFKEENFTVTPQWNNIDYNKSLKSNEGFSENVASKIEAEQNYSQVPNAVNLSPSKGSSSTRERKNLGSAPKAAANVIVGHTGEADPFKGEIPIRK